MSQWSNHRPEDLWQSDDVAGCYLPTPADLEEYAAWLDTLPADERLIGDVVEADPTEPEGEAA
jgi:hypothetical protein